jgi:hypothetical protein
MIGAGGLIIMGRKNTIQVFSSGYHNSKAGYLKNRLEELWRVTCGLY